MLIAFTGSQGSGKTLSISVLGTFIASGSGAKLYASYDVKGAVRIQSIEYMFGLSNCVILLDELWLTVDSRLWKDNVRLSRWIFQCRKRGVVVMYTTQHMDQIDLRVRNATDYQVICELSRKGIWLKFVDYHYQILLRKYLLSEPARFYSLYDSYQVMVPLT